jgi:hypothetical protein
MSTRRTQQQILVRLRKAGGIQADLVEGELRVGVMGAEPTRLAMEIVARPSEEDLERLLPRLADTDRPAVLITRELAARRRQEMRRSNVSWIEYGTGFVHLRAPGLAVDLPEDPAFRSAGDEERGLPSLAGKAGIIVEVLIELAESEPLVEQPRVAELAGVTQAWTSKVFSALVEAEALQEIGAGPRKRWKPRVGALFDLWTRDGEAVARVTPLYVWARSPKELLGRFLELEGAGIPYAIGGVAAADLYAPTLTEAPDPEIWIPADVPPEALEHALEGSLIESGANVLIWQVPGDPALRRARAFRAWGRPADDVIRDLRLVSPGRAVIEAAAGPERAPEVAERLREEVLVRVRRAHGDAA